MIGHHKVHGAWWPNSSHLFCEGETAAGHLERGGTGDAAPLMNLCLAQ